MDQQEESSSAHSSLTRGPENDQDLMRSLMAGQAGVDVSALDYQMLSWDEVEDSKKVRS